MNGLRVEQHGPVAELILCRPERHNALDERLIEQLQEALEDLGHAHGQPIERRPHVLILRAEGAHFCAGADLNWMKSQAHSDFEHNREDARQLARLLHTLHTLPMPTLALVQGAAYGGALGLIAACDMAIAAEDARFCLSEVSLGLVPAMIAPYVVRAMGGRQAQRYMLSTEPFDAITACRLGLVHETARTTELLTQGRQRAVRLCQNGPEAMKETKRLLAHLSLDPALYEEITVDAIARVRVGKEAQEGMQAFFDKRRPAWRQHQDPDKETP
ncbi:enoyl-CoA hydratase-related protein [Aeromonas schubertii]|uniref:enoyl-CoA hydratase-related protein n=1 Tax=Aeromonas schubertii TaxID=652 RepID=UPI0010A7C37E|nr:enoyl-CoA hydratase-related protein [Aeromonas schubertii]QCG48501.1 crotonase [Aeromonas schubertii]